LNAGERTSGTQIWIGRKPRARNRSRCARTLSRAALDLVEAAMLISARVTCNLARAGSGSENDAGRATTREQNLARKNALSAGLVAGGQKGIISEGPQPRRTYP
jgi:hypothetical protein